MCYLFIYNRQTKMIPWLNDHTTLRGARSTGRPAGNSEFIQILNTVEEKQNPKARKRVKHSEVILTT